MPLRYDKSAALLTDEENVWSNLDLGDIDEHSRHRRSACGHLRLPDAGHSQYEFRLGEHALLSWYWIVAIVQSLVAKADHHNGGDNVECCKDSKVCAPVNDGDKPRRSECARKWSKHEKEGPKVDLPCALLQESASAKVWESVQCRQPGHTWKKNMSWTMLKPRTCGAVFTKPWSDLKAVKLA